MMLNTEFLQRFSIYKMAEGEKVESFDCGDADLNDFILTDVPLDRKGHWSSCGLKAI